MAIIAKRGDFSGPGIEYQPGTHQAVLQGLVVLGTHKNPFHKPGSAKPGPESRTRILLKFELPDCVYEDSEGNPRCQAISQAYTLSLDDRSNLHGVVASALGRALTETEVEEGMDLEPLLGSNLFIVITEGKKKDGSVKYDISSTAPIPQALPKRALSGSPILFDMSPDENGKICIPDDLPNWVKEDIMASEEYQEYLNSRPSGTRRTPAVMPTVTSSVPKAAPKPVAIPEPDDSNADLSPVTKASAAQPQASAEPAAGMPDLTNVPEYLRAQVIEAWLKMPKA